MNQNGQINSKSSVWRETEHQGLATIRKIILHDVMKDYERRIQEMELKFEQLHAAQLSSLQDKENELRLLIERLENIFQTQLQETKATIVQEMDTIKEQTKEQQTDFGKVLIQLGKEWSVEHSKG